MKPAPTPFLYWPDRPLPPPPVLTTSGEWVIEGDGCIDERMVFVESGIDWRILPVPDELWMRQLLSLDLSAPSRLVAFVNDYGMLWRHPPKEKDERVRRIGDLAADLRVFRNIARLFLTVVGDSGQHEITDLEKDGSGLASTIQRQSPNAGRLRWAAHEVNRQLVPMHPRITAPPVGAPLGVTLANVLAVQMFNFAIARPHVSECEWCHSAFIFQIGRAQYGGHRSDRGVRYCTPACAQAVAHKKYRQRKRIAKAKAAAERSVEPEGRR